MALLRYDTINIGTIKAHSQGVRVFWAFDELKRKDIAVHNENGKISYAVEKNCSCQGEVLVSDAGITLEYNDKGFVGNIEKSIKVYLADPAKPVIVKNNKGVDEFNQELGFITLKFIGIVSA